MGKILKAYKFRLYPNVEQETLINKTLGCSRFIYNYFLDKCKEKYINSYYMCKEIKNLYNEYEFLKEVDSCALRCSIFNLEDSFKRFFNKQTSYPKFKSKYRGILSYRTNNIQGTYKNNKYNSISIDLEKRIIKLPKLKEVKIRGYRKLSMITGRIINATITKEASKYYVSVVVESFKPDRLIIPTKIIGIDVGIKDLVITSDGYKIKNQKQIEKYEKKIKGLNRWLARKQGSKNRYKVIKKLQTVYKKLRNARKYYLHDASNKIIKDNDIIVTEHLNINNMVKNKNLSKKILDASFNELIRQLKYKCLWYDKLFYQTDTYYPSSQICSYCGYKNSKVKDLSIREWTCKNCGNKLDRDFNASVNIMFEGVKKYLKYVDELQVN